MQLEDYFNFLAPGDIRLKGTRVGIENVLYEYSYRARTPEEIVKCFYTITLEQVHATILYYLHNKEEVSTYMADWLEHGHRAREEQRRNPPPVVVKLMKLKAERAAMNKADVS